MHSNKNKVYPADWDGLDRIAGIISGDVIFFPKSVLGREDVYEESKMMFSVIFTESLRIFSEGENCTLTVSKEMKKILSEKSDSQIQFDCCCSGSKVGIVKSEVLHLINHENISNCIRETGKGVI